MDKQVLPSFFVQKFISILQYHSFPLDLWPRIELITILRFKSHAHCWSIFICLSLVNPAPKAKAKTLEILTDI